jgi:hypothetical protein
LVWVVMVEDEEEEAGRNEAELASLLLTCNHLLCVRMSDGCRDSDRSSRSITLDAHSHSQHLASTQGRKKAHTLTLCLLSLPSLSFPHSLCSRSASPRPVTSSVDAPVSVSERGLGLILRFRRTTFRLAVFLPLFLYFALPSSLANMSPNRLSSSCVPHDIPSEAPSTFRLKPSSFGAQYPLRI